MNETVYVTVPAGIFPGQSISVHLPDGRTVSVVVPQGMTPGSTFGVQYSPHPCQNHVTPTLAPPSPVAPPGQKLLLVRVPWGTAPGAMVNIEVPDEPWRTIAAQVPPNVTEFHVAYTPTTYPSEMYLEQENELWQQEFWQEVRQEQWQPDLSERETPKEQQPLPSVAEPLTYHQPQTMPGKKLLLVRVPPGTPAGSMLTIEDPDAPGVNINVEVPPHVTEFHVAYTESNTVLMQGSTKDAVNEKSQQQNPPQYQNPPPQQQDPPKVQDQVPQKWQQEPVVPQKQQQQQEQQHCAVHKDEILRLQEQIRILRDQELERLRQERRQQNNQYVNAGLQIGVCFAKAAIGSYFESSNTT